MAAFGTLREMLAYKTDALIAAGHPQELLAVPPANTSRRCPPTLGGCGHIGKENRKSQAVFSCARCGLTEHAGIIGATNVTDAALARWVRTDGSVRTAVPGHARPRSPSGELDETDPSKEAQPNRAGRTGVEPRTTDLTAVAIRGPESPALQAGEDANLPRSRPGPSPPGTGTV